jgi:hypothetical protein
MSEITLGWFDDHTKNMHRIASTSPLSPKWYSAIVFNWYVWRCEVNMKEPEINKVNICWEHLTSAFIIEGFGWCKLRLDPKISKAAHEGNTMRKIMGNKPQVSSAIIIHSPLQISWNDLLHRGQTADVSIIRAKTRTFSIETLDVHLAPWWEAWFGLIRPSRHASGQPLS